MKKFIIVLMLFISACSQEDVKPEIDHSIKGYEINLNISAQRSLEHIPNDIMSEAMSAMESYPSLSKLNINVFMGGLPDAINNLSVLSMTFNSQEISKIKEYRNSLAFFNLNDPFSKKIIEALEDSEMARRFWLR